jgi:hypothetical protein
MGDLDKAAAAFACARQLDSAGWSLCLDLADVRAEQGDVAAAASLVEQGLEYDPHEVTLRAANAAHAHALPAPPTGTADRPRVRGAEAASKTRCQGPPHPDQRPSGRWSRDPPPDRA